MLSKLKDFNITDITPTNYFNVYEVNILKNYLRDKGISFAQMWQKCMDELEAGNYAG